MARTRKKIDLRSFDRFEKRLRDNVRLAIKEQLELIVRTALNVKFYTTRSGSLDKAYVYEIPTDFFGGVYLDKLISNAPYAYAIHEGRSDWPNYTPDKFLERAIEIKKPEALEALKKAVLDSFKDG